MRPMATAWPDESVTSVIMAGETWNRVSGSMIENNSNAFSQLKSS